MRNRRTLKRTKLCQSTYILEQMANQRSRWDGCGLEILFPRMSPEGLHQRLAGRCKDSEKEKMTVSSRFLDVRISSSIARGTGRIRYRIQPKLAKILA